MKSFLYGELRVLLLAVSLAFVVMTILFIFPVFVAGNPKFAWLTQMEIVSKVLIPMQILLAMFIVGTAVNALVFLVRAVRGEYP